MNESSNHHRPTYPRDIALYSLPVARFYYYYSSLVRTVYRLSSHLILLSNYFLLRRRRVLEQFSNCTTVMKAIRIGAPRLMSLASARQPSSTPSAAATAAAAFKVIQLSRHSQSNFVCRRTLVTEQPASDASRLKSIKNAKTRAGTGNMEGLDGGKDAGVAMSMIPRGPVSWAGLGLVAVAAASAVAYYQIERERRLENAMGKIVSCRFFVSLSLAHHSHFSLFLLTHDLLLFPCRTVGIK